MRKKNKAIWFVTAALGCTASTATQTASAQDAETSSTELPALSVTTTAKAKKAPKTKPKIAKAKKTAKTLAPPQAAAPATLASTGDGEIVPGTSATDTGNAVNASSKSALTRRAEAPNAVVVIEGAQLQQYNQMSVGDVVRRLPGVTFPGVNRSRDIKLRGIGKEYTQVLLDGRPLLDGDTSRNMEVDRIPASFIERIEITRTPLANMDSQGAAGTVNIHTRRAFDTSSGQITVGAGHLEGNGTPGEISAWKGGEAGPLRYFVGGGYQRRLVQESATEMTFDGAGNPDGGERTPQHRKFDEYTFLSRFEIAVDPANTIVVAPSYLRTTEDRDQTTRSLDDDQQYVKRNTHELRQRIRETAGLYTEWQHAFDAMTASRVFFDYQKGREDTTRASWRTNYRADGSINGAPNQEQDPRYVPIDLERIATGAIYNTRIGRHSLEAGFGWAERTHDEKAVRGFVPQPEPDRTYTVTEDIYHAYLSDSFTLTGRDLLTLGLRLEHSITETVDDVGIAQDATSTDFNPSFNYRLSATDNLDFRLGIARTLRRPDLSELTPTISENDGNLSDPHQRGNPDTRPEKIWGLDIGGDYYLFNRKGLLSANVFARSFEDKIESTLSQEAGEWIATTRNAGDGKLYGVELEGRIPLVFLGTPDLTLWANATAMKSELTDQETGQKRRFDEQPDFITNVGLDYYMAAWDTTFGIGYNRTYAYDQDILLVDGTRQQTDFSALDRLDASVRIGLGEELVLTLSASNLLRARDERVLTILDDICAVDSRVVSDEPSPSIYYARLTKDW